MGDEEKLHEKGDEPVPGDSPAMPEVSEVIFDEETGTLTLKLARKEKKKEE